jgi:hypothetical protein
MYILAEMLYSMKLDLLTNATVVDDAMRFVSDYSNYNKRLISKREDYNQEHKEQDYDDKEDLSDEQREARRKRNRTNNKYDKPDFLKLIEPLRVRSFHSIFR